jgi:glycosyltransferase involved in cell wall biosynthesis
MKFLFVDDGSSDDTLATLSRLTATHPTAVSVLPLPVNGGKAEAVRAGLRHAIAAGASEVGFWDADLATPLEALPHFLEVFATHPRVDWVIGARVQLLGREIRRKAVRHYAGRMFATAASLILGLPVYDTQCGAKVFRVDSVLEAVLADKFRSRWVFDVEMIARYIVIRRRAPLDSRRIGIYELPLDRWIDVSGSKVKGSDFARAALELARIWLSYRGLRRSPVSEDDRG